jgi:hypothetical protein
LDHRLISVQEKFSGQMVLKCGPICRMVMQVDNTAIGDGRHTSACFSQSSSQASGEPAVGFAVIFARREWS